MPGKARIQESRKGEEPDHSKFDYVNCRPKQIDEFGAVKTCVCKKCKEKRNE